MVKEGILLRHKISSKGRKVDKAKPEVIEQMQPPTNTKKIRSFLRHAKFYRHFIKNFQRFTKSLYDLHAKDVSFEFTNDFLNDFNMLK